jgi:hypothetical protein
LARLGIGLRTAAGAAGVVSILTAVLIGLSASSGGTANVSGVHPSPDIDVETLPPEPSPSPTPTLSATSGPTHAPADEPPAPAPPPKAPPAPPAPPLSEGPATTPAQAVANAYAEGLRSGRFDKVGVALFDRQTGTLYAKNQDAKFHSASVFKVFVAAKLLHTKSGVPTGTSSDMWKMITCSDNDATNRLLRDWAGGTVAVVNWVQDTYGIPATQIALDPSDKWGWTQISARGMVSFYRKAYSDSLVKPWLYNAMAHAKNCSGYGLFGLPAAAASWAVKLGWTCCTGGAWLNSTGYVDSARYIAILLTNGDSELYYGSGRSYINAMARALLPGGHVPQPAPTPTPTPTPTSSEPPTTEPPTTEPPTTEPPTTEPPNP